MKITLPAANFIAAGLVTAFFLALRFISPDPYLGYFLCCLPFTLGVNLVLALPFLLAAGLARKVGKHVHYGWPAWSFFGLLSLATASILFWLWSDQFEASRGFAVLGAIIPYGTVVLPLWIGLMFSILMRYRKALPSP